MSKPSLSAKIKKIAEKKAKMEMLKHEITELETEVQAAKDKAFCRLSKQFFAAETAEKRTEIEAKIKVLME